jgi:hypothetical protein
MLNYPLYHAITQQNSYSLKGIPKENYAPVGNVPPAFDDDLLPVSAYRSFMSRIMENC